MAFVAHTEFKSPPSPDVRIWRYMDLVKLLSLLESSSLYFVRVDQLGEFDAFEGYYPTANVDALEAFARLSFDQIPEHLRQTSGITSASALGQLQQLRLQFLKVSKNERLTTFVNSWHVQEHESAAMWKLYLTNSHGVAIQSTYQRLIDSLKDYSDFEVFIGMMQYVDFAKTPISLHNGLLPFMHKRKSFEHEAELRALIWTPQHGKNVIGNPELNKFKDIVGLRVPIAVPTLVERIYLAPSAPPWIGALIAAVVKRFGLSSDRVAPSALAARPPY